MLLAFAGVAGAGAQQTDVWTGSSVSTALANALNGVDKLFLVTAGLDGARLEAKAIDAAKATFAGDRRLLAHRGDVAEVAAGLPAPGVVVLDPPRTGAGRAVIDTIAAAGPRVVVYVACDIGRFARDLGFLTGHGYRLRSLRAFDAFPGTHHVEAVGCLTR